MATHFVRRISQLALAATMLLPATFASAEEPNAAHSRTTTQTSAPSRTSAIFDDLGKVDDPKLESQRAGYRHEHYHRYHDGLSGGEILLCVVLLIVFFPIGLIVLIVLVCEDD